MKIIHKLSTVLNIVFAIFIVFIVLIIANQRLTNNEKSLFGYRIFSVATGSMIPKYEINDIVIAKEHTPSDIKVGDDVVYLGNAGSFSGKIVTHRVINVDQKEGKYFFETQGIANSIPDPVIDEKQLYGVVIAKSVILTFIFAIVTKPIGFFLLIFIPIIIFVGLEIIDFLKERKRVA